MAVAYEPEENVLIAELQENPSLCCSLQVYSHIDIYFFIFSLSDFPPLFPTCHIPQLISKHQYVIQVMSSGDFISEAGNSFQYAAIPSFQIKSHSFPHTLNIDLF